MFSEDTRPLDKIASNKEVALYGQIFDRIREWIRNGKLKEGDMLPSERTLAELFDVSRVPVREALKVLEFMGVVQRVQGKGVYVKKISVGNIIDNIDFVMMNPKHTLLDLFEVREGIETQAAYLAAQRRTEDDLAAMENAQQAMKRIQGGDILEPFMDFHSAVITASHNMAIVEINQFLSDWLRYLRKQFLKDSNAGDKGTHDHGEVFECIKAGDDIGAARKMREHLERAKAELVKTMKENEARDLDNPVA